MYTAKRELDEPFQCSLVADVNESMLSPSALPLDKLEELLAQAKAVDDLVKSFKPIEIR